MQVAMAGQMLVNSKRKLSNSNGFVDSIQGG